jgi:hypothetical protein
MATTENMRPVRELGQELQQRVHYGLAIRDAGIQPARDFLRHHDFPPASGHCHRLLTAAFHKRLEDRSLLCDKPDTQKARLEP